MRLFKKKRPTFPKTEWNDLSVRDLLEIKSISELQLATEDEKNLKVAALLAGISYEDIIQVPLSEVKAYMDNAEFLLQEPKPRKVKHSYIVNGRKYRLLRNEMDMLTSQYVDFQAVYKDGFDKRPAELLSIMMVPEGHEYNDGYDKERVIEDMYDMHVEEALGIVDFFTRRFMRLTAWTVTFLRWRIRLARMLARKEEKELYRAMELQLNLMLDEASSMFGLIARKPSGN